MSLSLESRNGSTSFYESFSDLIFGTMAIFVLLLVIVLIQLQQQDAQRQALAEEVKEKEIEARAQRDAAREQMQELTQKLAEFEAAVKAQGLELVIAVDTTGSMEAALGHLVETITTIARVLPKVAPEVRIGVVAYGRATPGDNPAITYPLQNIERAGADGGRSFDALFQFMNNLEAKSGLAPVGDAIELALGQLSRAGRFNGHQVLFVLGDAGPFETTWQDVASIEAHERRNATNTTQRVGSWVRANERRAVVSLYSGSGDDQKSLASRAFFNELATAAGQPEHFTANPGRMLAYLLTAIVPER